MATVNVGILTTAGKALVDRVNAGQTKVTYSKIVFSSMDNSALTDEQVKALTSITPADVTVSVPETTLDSGTGETKVRGTGDNQGLTNGVYIKTYAVYAKDDTGAEILYGVTVSDHPNFLVAFDGLTPQSVTYTYRTVISLTDNVNITSSADIYATEQDVNEAISVSEKSLSKRIDTKADDSDTAHLSEVQLFRKPAGDLNDMNQDGIYKLPSSNYINIPDGIAGGTLYVVKNTESSVSQLLLAFVNVALIRYRNANNVWTSWKLLADNAQFNNYVPKSSLAKTKAVFQGDVAISADLNNVSGWGTFQFGGTNIQFVNGPAPLKGLDRWGTLEQWSMGGTCFQKIYTNQSEIFFRQASGYLLAWGPWCKIQMATV